MTVKVEKTMSAFFANKIIGLLAKGEVEEIKERKLI